MTLDMNILLSKWGDISSLDEGTKTANILGLTIFKVVNDIT